MNENLFRIQGKLLCESLIHVNFGKKKKIKKTKQAVSRLRKKIPSKADFPNLVKKYCLSLTGRVWNNSGINELALMKSAHKTFV